MARRKIDFHMHTEKITTGELKEREISEDKFIEKMKEHKIGLGSITNHHKFNYDYWKYVYDELIKENIEILPGIEVNVTRKRKREGEKEFGQINIIYPKSKVKQFKEACEEYWKELTKDLKNKDSKEFESKSVSIESLYKFFDDEGALFFVDQKGNKTHINKNSDAFKFLEEKKVALILDAPNPEALAVLVANESNALIGSDVTNWDEYNSEKLVGYVSDENIDFETFVSIIKNDQEKITNLLKEKQFENISKLKGKIQSKEIEYQDFRLFQGINLIFGSKSTGKSEFLKFLYESRKNDSIYYKSDKVENLFSSEYEKIAFYEKRKHIYENFLEYEKAKSEYKKFISKIVEHKEEQTPKLSQIINYINNTWSGILFSDAIKKQKVNKTRPENIDSIIQHNKNIKDSLNELENQGFNKEISNEMKEINESLKNIIKSYKKLIKDNLKDYRKFEFLNNLEVDIGKIILKVKGKNVSSPQYNLFSNAAKRKETHQYVKQINNRKKIMEFALNETNTSEEKIEILIKLDCRPNRKKPAPTKDFYKDCSNDKPLKEKETLKRHLNEYEENWNWFFDEKIIFKVDEIEKKLSSGQKAIFILNDVFLNDNKDYIFLDEPEAHFETKNIEGWFFQKIREASADGKKIAIITHNPTIGINSIPQNYINFYVDTEENKPIYKLYEFDIFYSGEKTNENKNKLAKHFDGKLSNLDYRRTYHDGGEK